MIPAPLPLSSLVLVLLVLQSWFQHQIPCPGSVGTRIALAGDGTEGILTFSFFPSVPLVVQKELLWNWGCPSG